LLLTVQISFLKETFIHTVGQHQGIIHKVCRIYRDTVEDREDLFQEILFQLWKAWPSFRDESRVASWMYKVALSTAVARYRKKQVLLQHGIKDEMAPVPKEEEHPGKDRLYRAISQLGDADKAIVALYLDDYTYDEMADILGITVNHVGVKLSRIRNKLSQTLNPTKHGS